MSEVQEVLPGVFRIGCPFGEGGIVFVYYIDAPEAGIVDSGVRASPREVIEPGLRSVGKSLAGVKHLFNTHGHWDHTGGNEELRRLAPGAKTYLHESDRYLLETVEAHTRGYSSYAVRLLDVPGGLEQVDKLQRDSLETPTPADVLVEDGQTIELGGGRRVRVVTTPGHSRGSVSYLLEDEKALFTGDGIQGLGSRPRQLPLVFDDSQAYRASIAKVSELGVQALCMGHSFSGLTEESGRDSVRKGGAARRFLEESGEGAKAVEEAARSVVTAKAGIGFKEFARAVFGRVAKQLNVELNEDGVNPRAIQTVHAFYRELTGAPLPA